MVQTYDGSNNDHTRISPVIMSQLNHITQGPLKYFGNAQTDAWYYFLHSNMVETFNMRTDENPIDLI